MADVQRIYGLCEKHMPDKWEGDGSCVICEGQRLRDEFVAIHFEAPGCSWEFDGIHSPDCTFVKPTPAARVCVNCGHVESHTAPAGDVADACAHPGCECGFDSRTAIGVPAVAWAHGLQSGHRVNYTPDELCPKCGVVLPCAAHRIPHPRSGGSR